MTRWRMAGACWLAFAATWAGAVWALSARLPPDLPGDLDFWFPVTPLDWALFGYVVVGAGLLFITAVVGLVIGAITRRHDLIPAVQNVQAADVSARSATKR